MKHLQLPAICCFALALVACGPASTPETKKKPPDMKALFGEDYQLGDIGHAYGDIVSISDPGTSITIDHGPIHGTQIRPSTSELEMTTGADLTGLSAGDPVEFLVRKGDDSIYRVMSICKMQPAGKNCLDDL